MKVKLEQGYKNHYTISDLERAKAVIKAEREDTETAAGWAEIAIREALKDRGDWLNKVLEASACTAKNCRAWDAYDTGTQDMDIWIAATAETDRGFIKIGAYLTDIWNTGSEDYRNHMYISYYTEAR